MLTSGYCLDVTAVIGQPSVDQPSALKTAKLKPVKIAGKWSIAWDVRAGTVKAILEKPADYWYWSSGEASRRRR